MVCRNELMELKTLDELIKKEDELVDEINRLRCELAIILEAKGRLCAEERVGQRA